MNIKSIIKRMLPLQMCRLYAGFHTRRRHREYESLTCSDTFERIYASGAWGAENPDGTPDSGWGSTGRYASEYLAMLQDLVRALRVTSVADLGCGDFRVGRAIAGVVSEYIGVDVAKSVIDHNVRAHSSEHVRFVRADLTCDPLPAADAAIARQVLQHLSNSEIGAAIHNILNTYPLVFITEHVYVGPACVPNIDIPHGPWTRVSLLSGVFVDQPPFNVRAKVVGDIYHTSSDVLRTWVLGRAWLGTV